MLVGMLVGMRDLASGQASGQASVLGVRTYLGQLWAVVDFSCWETYKWGSLNARVPLTHMGNKSYDN